MVFFFFNQIFANVIIVCHYKSCTKFKKLKEKEVLEEDSNFR